MTSPPIRWCEGDADRAAMGRGEINADWGMGEHLALRRWSPRLPVRLSGEGLRPRHLHPPPRRDP